MKSLTEIHHEYRNRIHGLKMDAIRKREEQQRREQAEAEKAARMYLEVLFDALTNDEIDRQLNREADPCSTREIAATFRLPIEANHAFTRCSLANLGEWSTAFDDLCRRLCAPGAYRLNEIRAAGFEVLVNCQGNGSGEVCIVPQQIPRR